MRGASPPRTPGLSFCAVPRSSSVTHIHIAYPGYCLDDLWLCRIALDLFAEPRHTDVDAAVEGLPVTVVRQIQELVARQYLVWMPGEGMQQVKLHRRQAEFFAIPADKFVGIEIE